MRAWLVITFALVAACYRPALDGDCTVRCAPSGVACPSDLHCNLGFCERVAGACDRILDAAPDLDGAIDGPLTDAAPACTPVPLAIIESLVPGAFFTPDFDTQRVAKLDADGAVWVIEGIIDTTSTANYRKVLVPAATETFAAARLAPGGTQIYLRIDASAVTAQPFYVATRAGESQWGAPAQLLLLDMASQTIATFPAKYAPGAPSAGSPRRMPFSDGNAIDEFEEVGGNLFRQVARYSVGDLGLVYVDQASLTRDGLKLVMLGQRPSDSVKVFVAQRSTILERFGAAAELADGGTTEGWPYYSADCNHLYFADTNAGNLVFHHHN